MEQCCRGRAYPKLSILHTRNDLAVIAVIRSALLLNTCHTNPRVVGARKNGSIALMMTWTVAAPAISAAFLGSLVEAVGMRPCQSAASYGSFFDNRAECWDHRRMGEAL